MSIKSLAIKIDRMSDYNSTINEKISRGIAKTLIRYNDFILQDNIYEKVRKITKPLHWTWIKGWLASLKKGYDEYPFKKPGVYVICGEPGSGKSSLAMEIMHRTLQRTGKGSYINTAIEIPRVDELTHQKYLHHPRYEITDFFDNGEIVMWPNHFAFAAMHIDESHILWNYRENQSNIYMRTFKPFMKYADGVRHYIGHIFLYTQMDKVDVQVMALAANNFCEVQVKKGFDYKRWMATGKFEITIIGWHIKFLKITSNGGGWNRVEQFTTFLERTFDMDYFNSLNLRDALDNAIFDNRYKYREVRI